MDTECNLMHKESVENIIPSPCELRVQWKMMLEIPKARTMVNMDGTGSFEEGDSIVVYAQNVADDTLHHLP